MARGKSGEWGESRRVWLFNGKERDRTRFWMRLGSTENKGDCVTSFKGRVKRKTVTRVQYIHTHTFPLLKSGSLPIHQTVSKNEKTIQKKKWKSDIIRESETAMYDVCTHQLSTLILVKEFRLGHCYPKIQNITTNTNISYFAFHFHHLCKSACQHFIFIFLYYSTLESCLFIKMRIYISTFKGYERFLKKIG